MSRPRASAPRTLAASVARGCAQRGVAAVELALLAPVLISLMLVVVELGRGLQQYSTLVRSARAAARYLAANSGADVVERARCLALAGRPLAPCPTDVVPVLPGLSATQVLVTVPSVPGVDWGTSANVSAALGSIEVRDASGQPAGGTIDLVCVTLSPPSAPYVFIPLLSGVLPPIRFGAVSATMPLGAS